MSDNEEKVCLTAGQLENIGKAYAKEIEGKDIQWTCPTARRWVRGFFGKKKPKKQKDPEDIVSDFILSRVMRKLNSKLDELI